MQPPRAELVVFDFDGTIVDTEWPHYAAVLDAFASFGLDLPLVEWQHRVGRADHPHWTVLLEAAVGRPLDLAAVRARATAIKDAATLAEPLRPGVADLIDRADRAGVAIAVASSSPRDWVEQNLERLGLLHRIAAIRTRDDVSRAKPWPDVYTAACAALSIGEARAVAIEDSHHGCTAAVTAGLSCVVAPNRVTDGQDFSHATAVVESLAHITAGMHGLP